MFYYLTVFITLLAFISFIWIRFMRTSASGRHYFITGRPLVPITRFPKGPYASVDVALSTFAHWATVAERMTLYRRNGRFGFKKKLIEVVFEQAKTTESERERMDRGLSEWAKERQV